MAFCFFWKVFFFKKLNDVLKGGGFFSFPKAHQKSLSSTDPHVPSMGERSPQAEICMGNPDGVMVTVHSTPSPNNNFLITVIIYFQNSE